MCGQTLAVSLYLDIKQIIFKYTSIIYVNDVDLIAYIEIYDYKNTTATEKLDLTF